MTKDLATRADSVCEIVEHIGKSIKALETELPDILEGASRSDSVVVTISVLARLLDSRTVQLEAIQRVHHDHLDQIGMLSTTYRITQIQDEISGILEALDIYLAAEAS